MNGNTLWYSLPLNGGDRATEHGLSKRVLADSRERIRKNLDEDQSAR